MPCAGVSLEVRKPIKDNANLKMRPKSSNNECMCLLHSPPGTVFETPQVDCTTRATDFVALGNGNGETGGAKVLFFWVCQDRQEERECRNKECDRDTHCNREPEASCCRSDWCGVTRTPMRDTILIQSSPSPQTRLEVWVLVAMQCFCIEITVIVQLVGKYNIMCDPSDCQLSAKML